MANITKATLLTFVNSVLNRSETDIDVQIQTVLDDLASFRTLKAEDTTQSLTSSSLTLDYPTLALDGETSIISVVLTDSSSIVGLPLRMFKGGYRDYLRAMESFTSSGRSKPEMMAVNNRKIYLWPAPNDTYTSSIWYYKGHAQDVDNIEYGNGWNNALRFGCAAEVASKIGSLERQEARWTKRYESERAKQIISTRDSVGVME